jgi:hypothetical protein
MAKKKTKRKSKWGKILFAAFIIFFAVSIYDGIVKERNQAPIIASKEDELNALQSQNKEMEEKKEVAGTDDYFEYVLRTKLGWLKTDEIKYSAKQN